jgi:two-component system, OmpR family, sensor histidine kinase QseC
MKNGTLSRKLFLRIAPTILVTIAVIGLFAYRSAKREINNVYDAQLINDASVLWALVEDEFPEAGSDKIKKLPSIDLDFNNQHAASKEADEYADARMFRIWKSGKDVMFSDTALPETISQQSAGFSEVEYNHERWRIYSQAVPNTAISIEVGEKKLLRDKLVFNILLQLSFSLLILVPAVGLLIWLGIKSGLGTIGSLVRAIRSRSPDDLSSIPVEDLPRDLSPLGQSINQLLSKLEHSLTAERRFSDHAAHQLRTPLAGLKLQLQMLAKEDVESERIALIGDLTRSTERATHLVEQLLRAARISHQPVNLKTVPLYHATASIVAEMGNIAEEKRLDISLEGHEEASVRADELLLKLMISNLLDNAIKYTPDSGKITINVLPQDGMWCLSISDTGPGISESEREAVFHRFYRADNAVTDGAGLGLAIVGDIIDRMSGKIALKTPENGHGLRVEVLLPKV